MRAVMIRAEYTEIDELKTTTWMIQVQSGMREHLPKCACSRTRARHLGSVIFGKKKRLKSDNIDVKCDWFFDRRFTLRGHPRLDIHCIQRTRIRGN